MTPSEIEPATFRFVAQHVCMYVCMYVYVGVREDMRAYIRIITILLLTIFMIYISPEISFL